MRVDGWSECHILRNNGRELATFEASSVFLHFWEKRLGAVADLIGQCHSVTSVSLDVIGG